MKLFKTKKFLIGVFILGFFLVFYFFQNQIRNFIYTLISPIQKTLFNIWQKIIAFFATISEIKELKRENEILKTENRRLQSENEILKLLKIENENLRKALNIGLEREFKIEMANFVGKDFSGDIFLIDKGENYNLKGGEVVITPEKFLIGRIIAVYPSFSKVQVFTDKEFSFDVEILDKNITGLAKGEGNFRSKINFLPKDTEILPGDKVLTSALGGKFPKGLFVGEVEKIEKSDTDFYQKAQIKPAFEIGQLKNLFIILNF